MKICGLQKLTLLDFPGLAACTVFTPGCNFRCPFCHNAGLVIENGDDFYSEDEIFNYLSSRKGKLDGVAITGGEPLLQFGIESFIEKVKKEGFKVKLDTNGSLFEKLRSVVSAGLVDYIAMDVKNGKSGYAKSAGVAVNLENVEKSVEFLKTCGVEHEFRTTVVKELNDKAGMIEIARWLSGEKRYYLQSFKDSGMVISGGLSAYSPAEMRELLQAVRENGVPCAELRGVD